MSIKVETKDFLRRMTRASEASDEGNSSSSPQRLDDYHDSTSGRQLDLTEGRRKFGNIYGSAKRVAASSSAAGTAADAFSKDGGASSSVVPPKLEHKRARNREAASRCRKRKLDRIAALETRVAELNQTNESLLEITSLLTSQVSHLKQQVIQHVTSGCDLSLTPLLNQRQSPPPSASSSSPSPSSPVRHLVPLPPPPSSQPSAPPSSRHRLPPSPPRQHHPHLPPPRTPTSPPPPSLLIGSILKHSPPLPPPHHHPHHRDTDSPEVEDVCLNLTVSSRRSPEDEMTSDGHEFKIEEEVVLEENGNHVALKNV